LAVSVTNNRKRLA